VSQNNNSVGVVATDPKTDKLFTAIKETDTSIYLGQDLGNNWSCQSKENQWHTRVQEHLGHYQVRTKCSHNTHDVTGARKRSQAGGTAVLTIGKMAFHACGADSDLSGLGRWTWARYRGTNGVHFRAVSIYRPTLNPTGCLSVWSQHKAYFQSINDDRDPRDAFMQDLEKEAKTWLELGDHIIIGGDVNDDIFGDDIKKLFRDELHMKDLIYSCHPQSEAPATYVRNGNRKTIDGLWGTQGIKVHACGYIESEFFFPGDHATLWADIYIESALGGPLQEPDTMEATVGALLCKIP